MPEKTTKQARRTQRRAPRGRLPTRVLAVGTLAAGVLLAALAPAPLHAQGVETRVRVRVVSHDAKIIGSGVGGARVTIRDAATGRVLAEGVQEGGTGDTESIVVDPIPRGGTVYDTPGAARFDTTLELHAPTRVVIEARGPLGTPHAVQEASMTTLLVPGVDVLGEGFVVELHGFTVEILSPGEGVDPGRSELPVRARVTMLCGCPIRPDGLWDADRLEVTARLLRDGRVVARTPLEYAGETSIFRGALPPVEGAVDELQVLVSDPARANFGIASLAFPGR